MAASPRSISVSVSDDKVDATASTRLRNVVASVSPAKRQADRQAKFETQTRAVIVLQKFWRANRARKLLNRTERDHHAALVFAASKKVFEARNNSHKLASAWVFYTWTKSPRIWLAWSAMFLCALAEHVFEFFSPWWVVVTLRLAFADAPGLLTASQLSLLFACYMLGFLVVRNMRCLLQEHIQAKIQAVLEKDVLELCMRFPVLISKAEVSRISRKAGVVPEILTHHIPRLFFNVLLFVASQVLVFQQSGVLGLIGFAFLGVLGLFAALRARFHRYHLLQQKARSIIDGHMWAYLSSRFPADSRTALEQMHHRDILTTFQYHHCFAVFSSCELVLLASTPLVVLMMGGFVDLAAYHLLSAALYFALSRLQFYFVAKSLTQIYEGIHDFLSLSAFLQANKDILKQPHPVVKNPQTTQKLRAQAIRMATRYWTPVRDAYFSKELSAGINLLYVVAAIAVMVITALVAIDAEKVFYCPAVPMQCLVVPPSTLVSPQRLPLHFASQRFSLSSGCELEESNQELLNGCLASLYDRPDLNASTSVFTLKMTHASWKRGNEQGFQAEYLWSPTLGRRLLDLGTAKQNGPIEDLKCESSCCQCQPGGCNAKLISLTVMYSGSTTAFPTPLVIDVTTDFGGKQDVTQYVVNQRGEFLIERPNGRQHLETVLISSSLGDFFFDTNCDSPLGVGGTIGPFFTIVDAVGNGFKTICKNVAPVKLLVQSQKPTTRQPSVRPTMQPTVRPTTRQPTIRPTTAQPTARPSTLFPTKQPSRVPTFRPTPPTSSSPTSRSPSTRSPSTFSPTSRSPSSKSPTQSPTSRSPTSVSPSTRSPSTLSPSTFSPSTRSPTKFPTRRPSVAPTLSPTTDSPTTTSPTTSSPTTMSPTTLMPTRVPTSAPTVPTLSPTFSPTSNGVTLGPTNSPTSPTFAPTNSPTTLNPTTVNPTVAPTTRQPTNSPTHQPTHLPTSSPTASPSTSSPTASPSTQNPTESPTKQPTLSPSISPTTANPTLHPTQAPSESPTLQPSFQPTLSPSTQSPTSQPTNSPTLSPTTSPTLSPTTSSPTTSSPTSVSPTFHPTFFPTNQPTSQPTESPSTISPTSHPTYQPTSRPTRNPVTRSPTPPTLAGTTISPTTMGPTISPTTSPTMQPTHSPSTHNPTTVSPTTTNPTTNNPTTSPTPQPTSGPSNPTSQSPTISPTLSPSTINPTVAPSMILPPECSACPLCPLAPTLTPGVIEKFSAVTPTEVLVGAGLTPELCIALLNDEGLDVVSSSDAKPLEYFFGGLAVSFLLFLIWIGLLCLRRQRLKGEDWGIFTPVVLPPSDSSMVPASKWSPVKYQGKSLRKLQKTARGEQAATVEEKFEEIEMEEPDG